MIEYIDYVDYADYNCNLRLNDYYTNILWG